MPLALLGASKLGPLAAGFGTRGCFLPAFNPDVWPPSNPSRRGKVATGSARGLKTWLFTVSGRLWHNGLCFNACHSGRLAALKPSPAGYGCHWLQALAQWLFFTGFQSGRLAALKRFPAGYGCHWLCSFKTWLFTVFGTMGCVFTAFNPDVWPPSNPSRRGTVATGSALKGAVFYRLSIRTFGRRLPGGVRLPLALLGASKLGFSPFPAGSGTMGCVSTPVTPDVWPPSNPPRQGTAATGCRLWHNGLFFTGFQSGRLAALKRFPAGYGCHWLC